MDVFFFLQQLRVQFLSFVLFCLFSECKKTKKKKKTLDDSVLVIAVHGDIRTSILGWSKGFLLAWILYLFLLYRECGFFLINVNPTIIINRLKINWSSDRKPFLVTNLYILLISRKLWYRLLKWRCVILIDFSIRPRTVAFDILQGSHCRFKSILSVLL